MPSMFLKLHTAWQEFSCNGIPSNQCNILCGPYIVSFFSHHLFGSYLFAKKNMVEKKDEGNPVTLDKVSRLINVTSISLSGMIQH